jgi:hypothetical protein
MPIMVPTALFVNGTYEWWVKLGNKSILFFLLMPFYAPLALIMFHGFEPWVKLAE